MFVRPEKKSKSQSIKVLLNLNWNRLITRILDVNWAISIIFLIFILLTKMETNQIFNKEATENWFKLINDFDTENRMKSLKTSSIILSHNRNWPGKTFNKKNRFSKTTKSYRNLIFRTAPTFLDGKFRLSIIIINKMTKQYSITKQPP